MKHEIENKLSTIISKLNTLKEMLKAPTVSETTSKLDSLKKEKWVKK